MQKCWINSNLNEFKRCRRALFELAVLILRVKQILFPIFRFTIFRCSFSKLNIVSISSNCVYIDEAQYANHWWTHAVQLHRLKMHLNSIAVIWLQPSPPQPSPVSSQLFASGNTYLGSERLRYGDTSIYHRKNTRYSNASTSCLHVHFGTWHFVVLILSLASIETLNWCCELWIHADGGGWCMWV